MIDHYANFSSGLEAPAIHLTEVTPADGVDLPWVTRAISVGVSGTLRVVTITGDEATLFVAAGTVFPVRLRQIWATGTTAANIVAMS